jgi:hypothetical protein
MNRNQVAPVALAAALLLAPASASAASVWAGTVFGLEGGMSFATLNGDAPSFMNPVAGPAAGVFARFELHPALSLQTEAMFTLRGGAFATGTVLSGAGGVLPRTGLFDQVNQNAADVRVQTLEVPVLLRIRSESSNALAPVLSIGPSLGFELSRSINAHQTGLPTSGTSTNPHPDLGLVIGLGVEKPHGGSRFTFDARTTIGLTNRERYSDQGHGIRNIGLVTVLGYGFSVGGP